MAFLLNYVLVSSLVIGSCLSFIIIPREDTITVCSFEEHVDQALYGYNDRIVYDASLEQCKEECTADGEACNSFDFNRFTESCFLSVETKSTHPEAFGKHSKASYYEKTCREEVVTPEEESASGDDQETSGDDQETSGEGSEEPCVLEEATSVGGSGGSSFSDREAFFTYGKITAVEASHGRFVDCFGFTYGDHKVPCHGDKNGGNERSNIELDDDEFIVRIKGRSGNHLDRIELVTNKRTLGPFGTSSGGASFDVSASSTSQHALAYIDGKSGSLIDKLTFYFSC